ncbi:retropepsin-like aspartic protease [Flavobacterium beibuense]|uniref:Retroviral aspartyl protease n=1 Tax=Flavobacterium beibuense TaxID=657326 RepID=A0A444W683_9FLAO|nr:retropepsin-like aspartic protease [Flavobacterium beibuense]RYJ41380.1 Retroviral aspartyl protease [Flavobacterium beibuense]
MENIHLTLKEKGYKRIKFKISKTQHLLVKGKINGVEGNFILDTGASNSCVDFKDIERFELFAKDSDTKAAGAGGTGMITQTSVKNTLKLGRWTDKNFGLVIFDMSHVNEALRQYKAKPVQGILGADILMKGKAIIDYYNHCVYLKSK